MYTPHGQPRRLGDYEGHPLGKGARAPKASCTCAAHAAHADGPGNAASGAPARPLIAGLARGPPRAHTCSGAKSRHTDEPAVLVTVVRIVNIV